MTTTTAATGRTAARHAPPPDRQAPESPAGHTTGWWGMVLFIATESTTFGVFLASYFYLRFAGGGPWPPPADKLPDLLWPSIGTGVLVVSCLPLALATRAAGNRRTGGARSGLLVVSLMGAAFVVTQLLDWAAEWPSSTLSKDAYGSLFYTITGLHLVHLVLGLLMLLVLLVRGAGRGTLPKHGQVRVIGAYWYFLVALAVAIYLVVYVSPFW